jgi:radical SAM superfamily enzyme YgiQ (UPF0313 family)
MSKLNLKFLTKKDEDYYFKINEPEEFLKSQEYVEGSDSYYPFFKSKDSDDYLLKVKAKYVKKEFNNDTAFDAFVLLKAFKMQSRDKKLKYGYYVGEFHVIA